MQFLQDHSLIMGSVTLTAAITMVRSTVNLSDLMITTDTDSDYKRRWYPAGGSVYDGGILNMPVYMCYTAPRYNMNTILILFLFC